MPVADGMLKPLTVYAASFTAELNGSTLTIYKDGALVGTFPNIGTGTNIRFVESQYGNATNGDSIHLTVTGNASVGDINSGLGVALTITGSGKLSCGKIFAGGGLTLDGAQVEARKDDSSGAIQAQEQITIRGSVVTAVNGSGGSGIHLDSTTGDFVIENSTVSASGQTGLSRDALGNNGKEIVIKAGSTVTATGSDNGIRGEGVGVLIEAGATVVASGTNNSGIETHNGNITIKNGANVKASGGQHALNISSMATIGSIIAPGYDPAKNPYVAGTFVSSGGTQGGVCATGHASYTWQTVAMPDVHNDGEEICVCEGCGQVLYRVPLSAYVPFQKVTAEKIRNAAPGATVEITTSRWYSFHKSVMEALAARPDVTLVVSFLREGYKGDRLTFTIPAGTDTIALLNEEGYAGFFYISGMLGTLRPAN